MSSKINYRKYEEPILIPFVAQWKDSIDISNVKTAEPVKAFHLLADWYKLYRTDVVYLKAVTTESHLREIQTEIYNNRVTLSNLTVDFLSTKSWLSTLQSQKVSGPRALRIYDDLLCGCGAVRWLGYYPEDVKRLEIETNPTFWNDYSVFQECDGRIMELMSTFRRNISSDPILQSINYKYNRLLGFLLH